MNSPDERFTALFERTYHPLLAYALRRVSAPADAADVVAETFLVAWRRLDEMPTGDDARPWLFGVARRVLANLYRGDLRRTALADRLRETLPDVVPPRPDTSPVEMAMSRLRADDQEILRLVAWDELARDEIAVVLDVPRATVRVRLHRARRRLLEQMRVLADAEELPRPTDAAGLRPERRERTAVPGSVMDMRAAARLGAEESR
ncbi:RNA polymerase sigma factor [Sanguibacter suaedae]|uniref:RNA polymerase sigma factor n=1 Tax=Sanguibacter suaedae TaxID=2795737 RepID=UPI0027DDCB52|nr:sigma-70 family RNA polymerase sigma factor [Sanguibacter suaedae]